MHNEQRPKGRRDREGDILSSLKGSDGKMDKGDVPRDYALISHGCLSITMETGCICACVYICVCVCVYW